MTFQDKSLQCFNCGATFTFSAIEHEQFVFRGYENEPKRCSWCRAAKKLEVQKRLRRKGEKSGLGVL